MDETLNKEKNKGTKKVLFILIGLLILAIVFAGIYYYRVSQKYKSVYFPGTYINGIYVGENTPGYIKKEIAGQCKDYFLTVSSPKRPDEYITADEVELIYVTDDTPEEILRSQNIYSWLFNMNDRKEYTVTTCLQINEELFNERVSRLSAFDDATAIVPVNAELDRYDRNEKGYLILPDSDGTAIVDKDFVKEKIKEDILSLQEKEDLSRYDIFKKAEILRDDSQLLRKKKILDDYCDIEITYKERNNHIDGEKLSDWIELRSDGTVILDEDKVHDFVNSLSDAYDTIDRPREFFTNWYETITVEGGNFGWKVDLEKEFDTVLKMIKEGTSQHNREPEWISKGNSLKKGKDLGDNYVEVNLTKQHLYYFKDGKWIVSTDIVSGNINRRNRETPTGTYYVYLKQRGRTLRGLQRPDGTYEYESFVNYWMPFIRGVGLHDATWRGDFGKDIYKYNGSHGCVNLPYKAAKEIYENIEVGCPVIVYFEPEENEDEVDLSGE